MARAPTSPCLCIQKARCWTLRLPCRCTDFRIVLDERMLTPRHPRKRRLIQVRIGPRSALASVLPTWNPTPEPGSLSSPLPNEVDFWTVPRQTVAASRLESVRGYVVALPWRWTQGENVWIKYPTSLIVRREPSAKPIGTSVAALDEDQMAPRGSPNGLPG
jgi:hypothetical protein